MDQAALSSKTVLETLTKTNRPPTDQETAIILQSMAPTNAKLKVVEAQISDTMAHIEALKTQVEQAETKLQRLRDEEAAILETFADHRRIFSPFRNLPEDVLREICLQACVEGDMPTLSYRRNSGLPYIIAQICSGMRHTALTTPLIWASMHVEMRSLFFDGLRGYELAYSDLARRASTWFERAGQLPLTIFIQDDSHSYAVFERLRSDPSSILFDTLLSYSTRWKELQFDSNCGDILSTPMIRIAALTDVDVPLLQSVSFHLDCSTPDTALHDSVLLTIPTLKRVKLETCNMQMFTADWAILTSVTLRGPSYYRDCLSKKVIGEILQQTKCLVFCDIVMGPGGSNEHYFNEISLPFLKTLIISESILMPEMATFGAPSILDLITAPVLEIFHIHKAFLDFTGFFKRSPRIWELSLPYFDNDSDKLLTQTMGFLSYCPSLTVLSLWPCKLNIGSHGAHRFIRPCSRDTDTHTRDANRFLRAFVEESNAGVICPRLQHFHFAGKISFSLQTLRLFLEGKQGDISALNVLPWKKVVVDIRGIEDTETRQQVLDLVSQKKAAGLDIRVTRYKY